MHLKRQIYQTGILFGFFVSIFSAFINASISVKRANYSCAVRRMSYKMGSVSSFWCHICACKFMFAYIYHAIFGAGGGRGLFEIFSSSCKNYFVVLGKCVERFKKSNIVLKCI